jgi:protein involved in polysaccharide export with SLBB domain
VKGTGQGQFVLKPGRANCVPLEKMDSRGTVVQRALIILILIGVSGCVTKSKAKADAQSAFLAGQQQAMIRMAQPHPAVVTFIGPVRNPTVPWSQELTLAKAIVDAGYNAPSDPKQIMIVRNGQAIPVDPQKLLNGEDVPLVAGDLVQIGQ